MEWMKILADSIQYIESHITDDIDIETVSEYVNMSPFYFQKGFAILCGFTVGEYIRNRRLTLAGNEIALSDEKIIDIALKYGYDSPDSFSKAFARFHGVTPTTARKNGTMLKSFAPLKIKFFMEGGYMMDYRIERKEAFTVIANAKKFSYDGAKQAIPLFWKEHYEQGKGDTVMGVYGINIDTEMGQESFEYLIADPYNPQKTVPDGFVTRVIPASDWAVFPCKGALPKALQEVNTKIFAEWLPALREYEFASGYCVEYYDAPSAYEKGAQDDNYYCEIWIPVKKK